MTPAAFSKSFLMTLSIRGIGGKAYNRPRGHGQQRALVFSAVSVQNWEKNLKS